MKFDLKQARRFLTVLDEAAETFTYQVFPDGEGGPPPTWRHGGALAKWLIEQNRERAGVFVMINTGDGRGRKSENVTSVRALFLDLDGAPLPTSWGLEPHIVVESSPEKFHAYWVVSDCPREQFTPLQRALAARFNGDPAVCDLSRVMRLPGFWHCKGAPFLTQIIYESGAQPYQVQDVVAKLELMIPVAGPSTDSEEIRHDYEQWLVRGVDEGQRDRVGTALAGSYLRRGLTLVEVATILERWNALNRPPMLDEQIKKIVLSVARLETRRKARHVHC